MLQTIREKLSGWVAVAFIGAIGLSLVVTFGNIDTGFTGVNTIVEVNDEEVPISEFRSIFQQQRQQWEANFRTQIPEDVARSIADSTLQNIIQGRAVSQHTRDQGYRVSDAEVIKVIESNQNFYVGGRFSQPNYEQMLASQGVTPQRYEFDMRQNLELQQFAEGVVYSAFYTPAEFRRYIELDGERRTVEFALLSPQQWRDRVVVSEESIQERYELQKGLYQTEENVALEYVEVNFEELLAEANVTDADVQAYFEENQSEFQAPDERKVSHILLARNDDLAAAGALAQELKQRLDAGEDFAALAAEFSDDIASAAKGGDLGWLGLGDAPAQEFEDALFTLELGQVSEPVETEFGYHLIRLENQRQGTRREFAEVREELTARLREDAAADRYAELLDELDERALESLDGLGPVADAMGLEVKTLDRFSRLGNAEFAGAPEVVDTVFSLEVLEDGENSPVVALDDGRAVVLRVTEYRPAEQQPLAAVREQIKAELEQEEAIALTAVAGKQLLDKLVAGAEPAAVLAEVDAELEVRAELARADASVPGELSAAVFRAPKPVPGLEPEFASLLLATGEFAIYRVTGVRPGQPEFFTQEDRDSRKEQLANRLGAGQLTSIVESLVDGADVTVATDVLDSELGLSGT